MWTDRGVDMIILKGGSHCVKQRVLTSFYRLNIAVVCLKKFTNGRGGDYGHPRLP